MVTIVHSTTNLAGVALWGYWCRMHPYNMSITCPQGTIKVPIDMGPRTSFYECPSLLLGISDCLGDVLVRMSRHKPLMILSLPL